MNAPDKIPVEYVDDEDVPEGIIYGITPENITLEGTDMFNQSHQRNMAAAEPDIMDPEEFLRRRRAGEL